MEQENNIYEQRLKEAVIRFEKNKGDVDTINDIYNETIDDYANVTKLTPSHEFIEWLKLEVTNQNSYAQHLLAYLYYVGVCVQKDATEAVKLCKLSIEQGNPFAGLLFASILRAKDETKEEGNRLFKMFSDKGYSCAQVAWATTLCASKDYKQSFELYQLSADKGNRAAAWSLAELYERGVGCEKNTEKAMELFALSVSKGFTKAKAGLQRVIHINYGPQHSTYFGGVYDKCIENAQLKEQLRIKTREVEELREELRELLSECSCQQLSVTIMI